MAWVLEQHLGQQSSDTEGSAAMLELGKSAEVKGDGMQDEGASSDELQLDAGTILPVQGEHCSGLRGHHSILFAADFAPILHFAGRTLQLQH